MGNQVRAKETQTGGELIGKKRDLSYVSQRKCKGLNRVHKEFKSFLR